MDVELKAFEKDSNRDFHPVQNLTMIEADFNQILRLKNQLAIAAKKSGEEENLSSVVIPTRPKDMDEQLKLAQKLVEVVNLANKQLCLNRPWYNMDKPESSPGQRR